MGVFNTLCLDETLDGWLMNLDDVHVPNAWHEDGWSGDSPMQLVCVFTYLTILLTLGDLAMETGILAKSQAEMFWTYRQAMLFYAADSVVHKIVSSLGRMVRVCVTSITPKKKAIEGPEKRSTRMTYGKEETLIAISQNSGKSQVAARLRGYRDCTGENDTQLTEQSLLKSRLAVGGKGE